MPWHESSVASQVPPAAVQSAGASIFVDLSACMQQQLAALPLAPSLFAGVAAGLVFEPQAISVTTAQARIALMAGALRTRRQGSTSRYHPGRYMRLCPVSDSFSNFREARLHLPVAA